jgi:hypothetical protein
MSVKAGRDANLQTLICGMWSRCKGANEGGDTLVLGIQSPCRVAYAVLVRRLRCYPPTEMRARNR